MEQFFLEIKEVKNNPEIKLLRQGVEFYLISDPSFGSCFCCCRIVQR